MKIVRNKYRVENRDDLKMYSEYDELPELIHRKRIVFNKLIETTEKYIDTTHPGILNRLNWYFFQKYRENFVERLLTKPESTLNDLLDYYGADTIDKADTAKYLIYIVLKQFFIHNPFYFEEAFESLKKSDWIRFKKILKKYLESI